MEEDKAELTEEQKREKINEYIGSLQTQTGHSNEDVRNILEAVHKRFLVVLNYSTLGTDPEMTNVRKKLKAILDDEMSRYE